jgi:transposase InsO family protein
VRWGTERIRGELLKLGIVVSNRSIRRYRWRKPGPADSQVWRTFLANHLKGIWAVDLLVVHTINYGVLYVFFFVSHERRELIHFDVTGRPAAAWIWRQVIEATPWSRQPTHLIHDRDAVYGAGFDSRLSRLGIAGLRTPVRSPKANAIAKSLVRTIRNECLDHIIVFNERHLRGVLLEFADYYNRDRPHRSLRLASPVPLRWPASASLRPARCWGSSSRLLSSSLSWTDICRPAARRRSCGALPSRQAQ